MALESFARSQYPTPPLATPGSSLDVATELRQSQRLDEAERLFRAVLIAKPDEAKACYILGLILQQTQRGDEALEMMVKATSLAKDEPAYQFALGQLLAELGQAHAAAVCMQKATQLAPNFGHAHEKLGLMWEEMGFDEQAERCFRRALATQPDLQASLAKLVQIHLCRGEVAEAVEFCRRWIAVAPRNAEARFALGRALDLAACATDAWSCYREALALDPAMTAAADALARSFRLYGEIADLDEDDDEDAPRPLVN